MEPDSVGLVSNGPDEDCESDDSFDRFVPTKRRRSDAITLDLEVRSEEQTVLREDDPQFESEHNDALANVLRSFQGRDECSENDETMSNKSRDIFGSDEESSPNTDQLLPVALPPNRTTLSEPPVIQPTNCDRSEEVGVNRKSYDINSFNDYMRMKIDKLNQQVNRDESKPVEKVSRILEGFSVFVNGYTEIPALVIRDLIIAHGGEYHCYYIHGKTTYVLASSVANATIARIREKEIYIKVDWLTESIAAGKPLPYKDYLIYEKNAKEKGRMREFVQGDREQFLDARDPNFIRNYYARSRLHLISTLAQDMKDFVANVKRGGKLKPPIFDENELVQLKGERTSKAIFHVDLDCFFVSVAVRENAELKGKPIAITHSKGVSSESMSEIASCSYAARDCGIKNGMLVKHALEKCPRLILLPYQFDEYVRVSKQIYEILASYTLEIRAVSCDEMYINASDICERFSICDPQRLAEHIRKVIYKATKCAASVGIGATSLLARLATRHAKPDGVHWVRDDQVAAFMKEENVRDLPGLGAQFTDRLTSCFGEISKCGELQKYSEMELSRVFGPKLATKIYRQCRGVEDDPMDFWETQTRKSVSCDINYGIRFRKKEELIRLVKAISEELERKLTECNMLSASVTLKLMIRSANAPVEAAKFMGHGICDTFTKSANFNIPTCRSELINNEILKLYNRVSPKVEDLRGVGVTCGKLKSKHRNDTAMSIMAMFAERSRSKGGVAGKCLEQVVLKNTENLNPEDLVAAPGITLPQFIKQTDTKMRRAIRNLKLGSIRFSDSEKICERVAAICKLAPNEENVKQVYQFLSAMLKAGKLQSLRDSFTRFLSIASDSSNSHLDWFPAANIIADRIRKESIELYEFPITFEMTQGLREERKTVPITNRYLLIREVHVCDTTGIDDSIGENRWVIKN